MKIANLNECQENVKIVFCHLRRNKMGNESCRYFVSEEEYFQLMLTDKGLIT